MPITTTSPRIISLRFISNKFPRLLAEREIIANALLVRYFSSEPWAKIVNYSGTTKLYRYFSRKRHGVAPVPQLSDGDFTCLDVEITACLTLRELNAGEHSQSLLCESVWKIFCIFASTNV